MTVTEAIHRSVPVFVAYPAADVYTLRGELVKAGIPLTLAADVVEFLPLAVARAVLDGMGVRFEDYYIRRTAQGQVIGQKPLMDEPVFREGLAVAGELSGMGDEAFMALVSRSSEYRAINKALNAGSQPEDLVCSPPVMIAHEDDRRHFGDDPGEPGKSWWKFWK
jgi:hypothetical protein